MDILDVKSLIEENYEIKIIDIEKIKNAYKVKTDDNIYCFKVVNYKFPRFIFIFSAIKHLQNNGFNKIPEFIKGKKGEEYIKIEDKYAYLTPWIISRESDYDNLADVLNAAMKLAELHKFSEGFQVSREMDARIGWFMWPDTFNTRINEILDFKRRIERKEAITEFDSIYLEIMNRQLFTARKSIDNLFNSEYFEKMKTESVKNGFCHHDYAHHNVLISKDGEVNIIDFDYCILDTHIHDLSSLIIRKMKNGKWDMDNAMFIINAYHKVYKIDKSDIPIMAAFMEFPQDYWQIGIQYYWEDSKWSEEFFLSKLTKIKEDIEEKQEFIHEFRRDCNG
ncbi:MAG: CotS family spore coat protein [Bacillota bacterium]|nr:CotS family spore coat protein [Bacillota bacterium]